MNDLSVILCSYNEEKNIGKTLKKLLKYNTIKEIIIIDDNSTDKTISIIKSIRNKKLGCMLEKSKRFCLCFFTWNKFIQGKIYFKI